jgi:hypothetical protein
MAVKQNGGPWTHLLAAISTVIPVIAKAVIICDSDPIKYTISYTYTFIKST